MDFDESKCSKIFNVSDPAATQKRLYSDMDKLILQVIIPSVSALGITGNSAFYFMVARLSKMRTLLSAYLATLAISDVMFLILSNIWYAITLNWTDISLAWPVRSAFGCICLILCTHYWYFVSVGVTSLISVERYLAVCKPLKYKMFQSKARNFKIISATLLLALILTCSYLPRYSWYNEVCLLWPDTPDLYGYPSMVGVCGSYGPPYNTYEGILLIVVFITSAIGNGYLYLMILVALSNRDILERSGSVKGAVSVTIEANRVRNQVARTLVINGIVFFICQIPSRVDNLDDIIDGMPDSINLLNSNQEATVTTIGHAFLFLNSIINPFIYVLSCRHYRLGMLEAFGCKRWWKNRPSTSSSVGQSTTNTSV